MIIVFPNGNEAQSLTNADADVPVAFGPPTGQPAGQRTAAGAANNGQSSQRGPGEAGGQAGPGGQTSTKFPDSIVADIIPFVDKHYRTMAGREHRAVTGISLGAGIARRQPSSGQRFPVRR